MVVTRRRRRGPRTVVAMLAGGLLGAVLLMSLARRERAIPPAVPVAPAPAPLRDVQARLAVPPVVGPAPAPVLRPPPAQPRLAPVEGATIDPDDAASVVVDIVDPEGRPAANGHVVAVACAGFEPSDDAGQYVAEPGPCTLQAVRRDGMLEARSARTTVQLREGDVAYLQLELRNDRTGGVGVRFRPTEMGMQVLQVVPHTPAWESGIEPGDVIVAVDGREVEALSVDDFVQAMTGPEGSEVEFTVAFPTEEGPEVETLRVVRTFLDH